MIPIRRLDLRLNKRALLRFWISRRYNEPLARLLLCLLRVVAGVRATRGQSAFSRRCIHRSARWVLQRATALRRRRLEAMASDEASEERSQEKVDAAAAEGDDAKEAPVPERVRPGTAARLDSVPRAF